MLRLHDLDPQRAETRDHRLRTGNWIPADTHTRSRCVCLRCRSVDVVSHEAPPARGVTSARHVAVFTLGAKHQQRRADICRPAVHALMNQNTTTSRPTSCQMVGESDGDLREDADPGAASPFHNVEREEGRTNTVSE